MVNDNFRTNSANRYFDFVSNMIDFEIKKVLNNCKLKDMTFLEHFQAMIIVTNLRIDAMSKAFKDSQDIEKQELSSISLDNGSASKYCFTETN